MTHLSPELPVWNIEARRWESLVQCAASGADALEDGAFARPERRPESGEWEIGFYATAMNKPDQWNYPFLEAIPGSQELGAYIGRAWHESNTGFVQFEVVLPAAAQALAADYESGASDLDFVTYEQAVELAMRGTSSDLAWLHHEFGRLAALTNL